MGTTKYKVFSYLQVGVVLDGLVVAVDIVAEVVWRGIGIVQNPGEEVRAGSEILESQISH